MVIVSIVVPHVYDLNSTSTYPTIFIYLYISEDVLDFHKKYDIFFGKFETFF